LFVRIFRDLILRTDSFVGLCRKSTWVVFGSDKMMSTMSPPSPHLPIFNFDFTTATSHKPAHSSPLSSSPIRASQTSPPLSPRDPNTLPRRGFFSSPINPAACNQEKSKWTRFETRDVKKNPLKQSRDNAVEGKRKLFLKHVRQRRDDQAWERRGGDQEVRHSFLGMNHGTILLTCSNKDPTARMV
jgi:hypothetical protein